MKKHKLLFNRADHSNFQVGFVAQEIKPWIELVEYQPGQTYGTDYTVLTTYQTDFHANTWYSHMQDTHKIIVDHLLDSDTYLRSSLISDRKLDLRNPHWMWYHTALMDTYHGYDVYSPQRKYTHDFIMLMNKTREHRTKIAQALAPELQHARWSYVEHGQFIGDPQERATSVFWEFYMNPEWYDSTCFHLVVESWLRSDVWVRNPQPPNYKTEVSEKIYKPLAYYQPFVVCGSLDTLKFLHSQGFETFNNLWSENYDLISSDWARFDAVVNQVRDMVRTYNRRCGPWDSLTEQKLQHNHHRFFDLNTVRRRLASEVIGDIQEFLE